MLFTSPKTDFEAQLDQEAKRLKQAAWRLPPGSERDELMRRARRLNVAAHLNEWMSSPGLQPPRAQ
jgi:hypothetical protein